MNTFMHNNEHAGICIDRLTSFRPFDKQYSNECERADILPIVVLKCLCGARFKINLISSKRDLFILANYFGNSEELYLHLTALTWG